MPGGACDQGGTFMKTNPFPVMVFFSAVLIMTAASSHLEAGEQIVHLAVSVDQTGDASGGDPAQGLREARARAVFQEAVELLPGSLSEARAEILAAVLSARAREYVLSYAQGKTEKRGALATTTWRIAVNEDTLKQSLKDWGVYFTLGRDWGYALELQAEGPGQYQETLHRLERLSGLERLEGVSPELRLIRSRGQTDAWRGLLEFKGQSWSAAGSSLEELWLDLWPNYFQVSEVQARVIKEMSLNVQGFSSVTGVKGCDRTLRGNAALVNDARLLRVDVLNGSMEALWKVRTPDSQRFGRFLDDYLAPRGLSYDFLHSKEE